ncbi:hypothetical protein BD289DRAFT_486228 [Coniella lustricola]|uniref:Uncharacterized protein n=1 Tax=Coniella lustricola TaxID=2025994 RepID=A0A2T2ZVU6_9PEZI|nr:hypothetical protein BD289DRAFT_486228 [Coniella lustricola]
MGFLTVLSRRQAKAQARENYCQHSSTVSVDGLRPAFDHPREDSNLLGRRRSFSFQGSAPSSTDLNMFGYSPRNPPLHPPASLERRQKSSSVSSGVNVYRPKTPQRPAREPRRPPVSYRKPGSFSSTSTVFQSPRADQESTDDDWSVAASRKRSESVASSTCRRAKDLLDAADEIKPRDFRSRLKATGAKDYGEDVADRNIRSNAPSTFHTSLSANNYTSPAAATRSNPALAYTPRGALKSHSRKHIPDSQTSHHHHHASQLSNQSVNSDASTSASPRNDPGQSVQTLTKPKNKNRLSLNTYLPTSLSAPPLTPRSIMAMPGSRTGINFKDVDWPLSSNATEYPPKPQSPPPPPRANVSMPRSPRAIPDLPYEQSHRGPGSVDVSATPGASYQHILGTSIAHVAPKHPGRLSNMTIRSSQSSTATDRLPSYDHTPLGCPRLQTSALDDFKRLCEIDQGPAKTSIPCTEHGGSIPSTTKATPTLAPCQPRPRSSSFNEARLRSGGATSPISSKDLTDDSEHEMPLLASCIRDWELLTPCNSISVSNASNMQSASSGRPTSRHTNATSVDSAHYWSSCKSYDSCFSANRTQQDNSASDWSATKPMWTGFNIDDYVSSDEDFLGSDEAVRRPTAAGEEDLLFNSSFGTLGAALPGLRESVDEDCSRASQRRRGPPMASTATVAADMEKARLGNVQDILFTSPRPAPQLPGKNHRGTFGRESTRPIVNNVGVKDAISGDVSGVLAEEPSGSSEMTDRRHTLRRSSSDVGLYEQNLAACRGQSRLSALGALNGGKIDSAISLGSSQDSTNKSSGKEDTKTRENNNNNNKFDHITAIRLRKQAKALQRARNAEVFHARRATAAFGTVEREAIATAARQDDWEGIERGRSLIRKSSRNCKGIVKAK